MNRLAENQRNRMKTEPRSRSRGAREKECEIEDC